MRHGEGSRLDGKHVLVTRAADQAAALCTKLEDLGAAVSCLPMTAIVSPESWDTVDAAINKLTSFSWLIFTSANAVLFFVERIRSNSREDLIEHIASGRGPSIAVIGSGTAAKTRKSGLPVHFVPSEFVAESFSRELLEKHPEIREQHVLWVRGNLGRTVIADELTAYGAQVETVSTYRNVAPCSDDEMVRSLTELWSADSKPDAVLFASSQSVAEFHRICSMSEGMLDQIKSVKVISIGPETSKTCRKYLGKIDYEASTHSIDGLVESVLQCFDSALHD